MYENRDGKKIKKSRRMLCLHKIRETIVYVLDGKVLPRREEEKGDYVGRSGAISSRLRGCVNLLHTIGGNTRYLLHFNYNIITKKKYLVTEKQEQV